MMMRLTEDHGSVLMEFIIVMPIYFLLLGSVFVIGELALHSIHLTASGDRNVAFTNAGPECDTGPNWERGEAGFWRLLGQVLSFDRTALTQRTDDATDYSYRGDLAYEGRDKVSQFAESLDSFARKQTVFGIQGHWTEAVAGRAVDNYTLTPVTRGFIAHWFYETERRVHDGTQMSDNLNRAQRDDIDEMLDKDKGSLGRAQMKGNYYEDNTGKKIRDYGYISFRRTEISRQEGQSYREGTSGQLASGAWINAALGEKDSEDSPIKFEPGDDFYVREGSGRSASPLPPSGSAKPVTWEFGGVL